MDSLKALKQPTLTMSSNSDSLQLVIGEQDRLAYLLIDLEKLAKELKASNNKPFEIFTKSDGSSMIKATALSKRLLKILVHPLEEFHEAYSQHRFNPLFRVFMKMRPKLSGIDRWSDLEGLQMEQLESIARTVNDFSARLKRMLARPSFISRHAGFRASGLKNYRSLITYFKRCFMKRSNLLFIRLDLSYKSEFTQSFCSPTDEMLVDVNFEAMRGHREAFIKHLKHQFKKSLIGYVWRLEYGHKKKSHFHVLIILDEAAYQADVSIAQRLGEHWKITITSGMGQYFNCNAIKTKYRYCMLGKIRVDNSTAWLGIHYFSTYVSLPDLYIKLITPNGHRALGKGAIGKRSLSLAGRPTKYKMPDPIDIEGRRRGFFLL